MNLKTLVAGTAMLALAAGAAQAATHHKSAAKSTGAYAAPAQPIAYDKLGAYMKASPAKRASGDWAATGASSGAMANNAGAMSAQPASNVAPSAGGGYTGVDTSATSGAPQAAPTGTAPQSSPLPNNPAPATDAAAAPDTNAAPPAGQPTTDTMTPQPAPAPQGQPAPTTTP